MKRLFCILIALTMVLLALTGCGKKDQQDKSIYEKAQ